MPLNLVLMQTSAFQQTSSLHKLCGYLYLMENGETGSCFGHWCLSFSPLKFSMGGHVFSFVLVRRSLANCCASFSLFLTFPNDVHLKKKIIMVRHR